MAIKREDLLSTAVSFFKHVKATKYCDMSIGRVLVGIGNEAYGKEVTSARYCLARNDGKGYNSIKENLPAVTFCGTFAHGHSADDCVHYNNLMVIDIDKLDEVAMMIVKNSLMRILI